MRPALRSRFRPGRGCRTPFRWAGTATDEFRAWRCLLEIGDDLEGELLGRSSRDQDGTAGPSFAKTVGPESPKKEEKREVVKRYSNRRSTQSMGCCVRA